MTRKNDPNASKRRTALAIFFWLLLIVGLLLIIIPLVLRFRSETEIQQNLDHWKQHYQPATTPNEVNESTSAPTVPLYPELLAEMIAYNVSIYMDGQAGLVDAWSYQKESFDLAQYGIEDSIAGYITIPSIDVEMPLYLGASYENLRMGFAQLSQTSMPIGGNNTNCVVACHRGWNGAVYLRDADQMEIGDEVILQNLWETLNYEVCEIEVIAPYEIDKVLIQQGRDMLTIVTCTPYGVGSHRLILYCERVDEEPAIQAPQI